MSAATTSCSSMYSYNLTYSASQTPPYPEQRSQHVMMQSIVGGSETNLMINNGLPFAEYTVIIFAFDIANNKEGPSTVQTQRTQAIGKFLQKCQFFHALIHVYVCIHAHNQSF